MSDKQQPIEINDDIVVVGPGQMLREAREALKITQAQVAEHLNLRLALVNDIENDNFDSNTPTTFVRGYLKNYARFVSVAETDVLAGYELLDVAAKQGAEMKSFSQITKKKAENNRLMFSIYVISFVLILMVVIWYWQEAAKDQEKLNNSEQASTIVDTDNVSQPSQLQQSEQGSEETLDAVTTEQTTEQPGNEEELEGTETDDAAFEQTLSTETPEDADVDLNSSEQNAEIITQEPVLDKLVFTFSGDCWVNIFDANGERMAWGIKKADYIMTLEGQGPFSITLGKPELVSISYNQQAIDMNQFEQGQIAKFTWPKQ